MTPDQYHLAASFTVAALSLTLDGNGLPCDPFQMLEVNKTRLLGSRIVVEFAGTRDPVQRSVWVAAREFECMCRALLDHHVVSAAGSLGRRWLAARTQLQDVLPPTPASVRVPDDLAGIEAADGPRFQEWPAADVAALPTCGACDMPIRDGEPHPGCEV